LAAACCWRTACTRPSCSSILRRSISSAAFFGSAVSLTCGATWQQHGGRLHAPAAVLHTHTHTHTHSRTHSRAHTHTHTHTHAHTHTRTHTHTHTVAGRTLALQRRTSRALAAPGRSSAHLHGHLPQLPLHAAYAAVVGRNDAAAAEQCSAHAHAHARVCSRASRAGSSAFRWQCWRSLARRHLLRGTLCGTHRRLHSTQRRAALTGAARAPSAL
jgi:hypothetical protein